MLTFKRHKIINSILVFLFVVYASSPLITPLGSPKGYLTDEPFFRVKDVAIFYVDLFIQLAMDNDDTDSSQPGDESVIVKRKRAVIKKFDEIEPQKEPSVIWPGASNDVFAVTPCDYISSDLEKDYQVNSKAFKGFRPLHSGVSPPLV